MARQLLKKTFKRPVRFFLSALLIVLWGTSLALAEPLASSLVEGGRIRVPSGEIHAPESFEWDRSEESGIELFVGSSPDGKVKACLLFVPERRPCENAEILELYREHLVGKLGPSGGAEEIQKSLPAPYPYPDSLEIRFDDSSSLYLGSSEAASLLIAVRGERGVEIAEAMAASFKEDIQFRHQNRRAGKAAGRLENLSGMASTLFLLSCFLVPTTLTWVRNRRRGESINPYAVGLNALAVGSFLGLLLAVILLSRFSWVGLADYLRVCGGLALRALCLAVGGTYFSRRWEGKASAASSSN